MRRDEFAASCKVLGVTQHELLDYQDGRLEFVEFSRPADSWWSGCGGFEPDVVITFGGDGGLNTHADHMMVSMLTTAAFHWCGQAKRYPEMGAVHQRGPVVLPDDELLFAEAGGSEADAVDGDAGYPVGARAEERRRFGSMFRRLR